jgi:hypothetical protein
MVQPAGEGSNEAYKIAPVTCTINMEKLDNKSSKRFVEQLISTTAFARRHS